MKKIGFPLVIALSGVLTGCTAQLQYTGELRIYEKMPNRPLIAVGKFVDERKSKTVGSISAMYRLEPETDVGVALQEQIVKALYDSHFNVVFVDESKAAKKSLPTILQENEADAAMTGVIQNFQIRGPNGAMTPVDVMGRLTVTTLVHGEKESHDHEVLVTGTRRMGIGLYFGGHCASFDDLYRRALEVIAVGIIDDSKVKSELEKRRGGKST